MRISASVEPLVEDRLFERLAQRRMTVGRGGGVGPVTDEQDIHRLDRIGQSELLAHGFGLEHADPQRVESERCGGEHHVVGDDRGVDVSDTLAVVLAGPHLGGVGADDDGRRSPEVARTACEALHSLRRFDDDEPLRLPVGARGATRPASRTTASFRVRPSGRGTCGRHTAFWPMRENPYLLRFSGVTPPFRRGRSRRADFAPRHAPQAKIRKNTHPAKRRPAVNGRRD